MKTPQQLSQEALAEFKAAYQEEFGEELSDAQALSLTRFRGQVRGSNTGYLVGLVFKVHR